VAASIIHRASPLVIYSVREARIVVRNACLDSGGGGPGSLGQSADKGSRGCLLLASRKAERLVTWVKGVSRGRWPPVAIILSSAAMPSDLLKARA
jgi:hypothetical protein